ncbi:MAG: adenosine deaminase [Anaerolineales bacterium]|nr:adenosine deaminase [Anaerolineales bacterium]
MIDYTLPVIDLHRHLDGSIRLETILDLGQKHNIPLPAEDIEELRPYVQITEPRPGVMAFIEKFKYMIGVLADYDACRRVAFENVEDAVREGIDYIELRFSPVFMAEPHSLSPEGVVEAILEGVNQGREKFDIQVNLIGIISRTYGPDLGWKELESLLIYKDQIAALDLAGDERNYPGRLFVDHIQEGRSAGWNITIHAGEDGGPDSIWQAVEELNADRIGHGISASRDPELMQYLAEKRIGVECNLTSNIQTRVVEDYPSHPLKIFLEEGILASINTDDPGISGINLKYEYETAAPAAGLSPDQIQQAQKNSLDIAFLSDSEKQQLSQKAEKRNI